MLEVICTFMSRLSPARLPSLEKPQCVDRLMAPISETLSLPGYRQDKSFALVTGRQEIFLKPNSDFLCSLDQSTWRAGLSALI